MVRSGGARSSSKARVLVVDDDHDLRDLCAELLELEGYEVERAPSAAVAIKRAEVWRPSIVVTDLNMPGMSGLELCDFFLREYGPPRPAVVVVSALAAAGPEAQRRGAAAFLAKPFAPDELLLTVRALLKGEGASSEPETARFSMEKAQARAAARGVADAALRAGIEAQPDLLERASHAGRWIGGFFGPATPWLLLVREGKLEVFASSDPGISAPPPALLSVAESVLETGATLILTDVALQPWLGVAPSDLRSIVSVPFRYRDVPVGALCLAAPAPQQLGTADAAILEHIARQSATQLMDARQPFLARSWLISRSSFRSILDIEVKLAVDRGEGIAVVLFRMPVDRRLASLLRSLPARRAQLAELREDVVALSVRAPGDGARDAASACAALVRSHGTVTASSELFLGPPLPSSSAHEILACAERLLEETSDAPGRSHVVVHAQAVWRHDEVPRERA